jgi:hypothetical protein
MNMTHTVHDVKAAVAKVAKHKDPRAKYEQLFSEIHGQITTSIREARSKKTVDEALKVFEDTAAQYEQNREHIIDTLVNAH